MLHKMLLKYKNALVFNNKTCIYTRINYVYLKCLCCYSWYYIFSLFIFMNLKIDLNHYCYNILVLFNYKTNTINEWKVVKN